MNLYTYNFQPYEQRWAEETYSQVSPIFLLNRAIIKSIYHNNLRKTLDTESWHNAVLEEECAKNKHLDLHSESSLCKIKERKKPNNQTQQLFQITLSGKNKRKASGRIQIDKAVLSARGTIWNILSIC